MTQIIPIGADHAGFQLKTIVIAHLQAKGYEVKDYGCYSEDSIDYADFGHPVASHVENNLGTLGIVICGSGNGINMTVNKHQGIRGALCWTPEIATLARTHNDANILTMPARFITEAAALEMVDAFFSTAFEGGRHQKRIEKIPVADHMKKLLPFCLVLITGSVCAQAATKEQKNNPFAQTAEKIDLAKKYMTYIDSSDLRKHLTVLASEEYEGRETGKKGQQLAAAYIQQSFKEDGCSYVPGMSEFQQTFEVIETTPGGTVTFGKKELAFKTDFVYMSAKRKVDLSQLPVYTLVTVPAEPTSDFVLIHALKGMDIRAELDEIRKNQSKKAKAIVLITTNYKDLYEYLEHNVTTKTMRLKDAPAKEEVPVILVRAEALAGTMNKKYAYLLGKEKEKKAKKGKQLGLLTVKLNTEERS